MTTSEATNRSALPGSVWVMAGAAVVMLIAVSARYGFHRDELYFVAAGRRLAWGYVDQPPLTPFIARLADLAPGTLNPTVLRIAPAFAAGAVVVLTAVLARRFGGSRMSMAVAAFFTAVAGFFLGVGHLLSTTTFDVLAWAALLVVVAALLDGADPRWWLAVGGICGVGLLNKHTILALVAALFIGIVATPQRRILASRWCAAGAGLALVIALPNLAWQASNGWPQLEMASALADGADPLSDYLLIQIAILSIFLVIPAVAGFIWLARGTTWRAFPIAFVVLFVVFAVTGGKGYYVAPLYLPLFAAGSVRLEGVRRPARTVVLGLVAVGGIVGAFIALPLLPPDRVGAMNEVNGELGETYAWDQLVDQVDTAYQQYGSGVGTVVVFTGNYGQAGAIEVLGSDRLPAPTSGHNNYWLWGPPDDGDAILAVGYLGDALASICPDLIDVAQITNEAGLENDELGTPIWWCDSPNASLASIWSDVRHYE